jgi:hypothetical protein
VLCVTSVVVVVGVCAACGCAHHHTKCCGPWLVRVPAAALRPSPHISEHYRSCVAGRHPPTHTHPHPHCTHPPTGINLLLATHTNRWMVLTHFTSLVATVSATRGCKGGTHVLAHWSGSPRAASSRSRGVAIVRSGAPPPEGSPRPLTTSHSKSVSQSQAFC